MWYNPLAAAAAGEEQAVTDSLRAPALFIGHGSPMNALEDNAYTRSWRELGKRLPKSRAILCLSAHYAGGESLVVDAERPETIHDFYGFPKALFDVRYPAPGSRALAQRVAELLPEAKKSRDWGLDHGAWSVLCHLYPEADVPVVQLSLDLSLTAGGQIALGERLRPLRDEGVMILGSGNIVHNLRRINPAAREPFDWASDFDAAVARRLLADPRRLDDYMSLPGAAQSVPTNEHFVPLLCVLGAARPEERAHICCQGYIFGSLSMTSCLFV